MKKKLIYSTALATLLSASAVLAGGPEMVIVAPSPFDGFYVGGNVSLHQTGFDITGDTSALYSVTPEALMLIQSQDGGDSTTDAYYGIRGGWGKVFMNRWYAGIEGFADFGDADGSIDNVSYLPDTSNLGNTTNSAHIGTQYGVAARLGMLLSPTTLAYAKLGAVWADVKSSVYATSLYSPVAAKGRAVASSEPVITYILADNSSSKTEAAFLWGFGVEQFIYRDMISLFAEYTHADFGSVSTSDDLLVEGPDANQGIRFSSSADAEVSTFTGGLNFHFGRDWL